MLPWNSITAPHGSASLMLDYKLPVGPGTLDLQANANYKSHVFFDVSNDPYIEQAGYWIANARASYATDAAAARGAPCAVLC